MILDCRKMIEKIMILVILGILIQSGVCIANGGDDPFGRATVSHGFKFQYFKYPGPSKSSYPLDSDDLDPEKDTHLFIPGGYSRGYLNEINDYFQLAYKDNGFNFFHLEYTPVDPKPDSEVCSLEMAKKIGSVISSNIKSLKKEKGISLERIITHERGAVILSTFLKDLDEKPKRIVLLDPPIEIIHLPDEIKITPNSAEVVEVFHTTHPEFYIYNWIGNRAFFVGSGNGPIMDCFGVCDEYQSYCKSLMSVFYYFDSFKKPYKARFCADEESFMEEKCDESRVTNLYNTEPALPLRFVDEIFSVEIYSLVL